MQVNQEEIRTAVPCHEWDYDIANKGDSVVSRFDLVCNQAYLYDLSSVVPMAASALLAPALGLVSDRAGRRPVMLFCAFGQLIATIGNCFAETYTFFVFTRVLIFVATDVTFLATFILIHEVTGNAHRSIFTLIDTAVPGIVVPPMMHALSLLEPRWMLAEALTIVTVALLVVWCCLQEESPAWLIATWKLRRAEAIVLLAAKENGVDLAKAGSTFMAIKEQLCKLDKYAAAAPMEVIMQTMKMRRRAVSVLLARFTLDATYIGLMLNDVTTGIPWEVAHVVLSMAYYASICGSMRRYGLRDTLSGLMVILSAFAIFEAIATFSGQQMVTSFLHAGMKVVVSGAMSVALCYTAETFPTAMRNAGISLSQCAGSVGNVVAIALVALSQPHVLYALSAFMVLLSVAAIQWLPEVLIEHQQSPSVHSEGERKAQLQASLKSRSAKSSHKHR
ncbi:solute carrier family 22 member 16-like [Dermacentor silvarum]|uniref:solute carrier family 22 member 16-like n=1 Tax=Dermacentor silvarum TaxID=543639 RepID=UPI00189B7F80|nr:solute carrier family 22 member 16-like [Dermacentor silvarum]